MSLRFKILSVILVVLFLIAQEEGLQLFKSYHGTLGALAVLAVFSALALWPDSSSADRVDSDMGGSNWTDRIDFEKSEND